jgi:histidinol phosphatase-like enzyme
VICYLGLLEHHLLLLQVDPFISFFIRDRLTELCTENVRERVVQEDNWIWKTETKEEEELPALDSNTLRKPTERNIYRLRRT